VDGSLGFVDVSGIGVLQGEKNQGKEGDEDYAEGHAQGEVGFSCGMFRVQEGVALAGRRFPVVKGVLAAADEFRVLGVPKARIDFPAPFHPPGRRLGIAAKPESKENVPQVPLEALFHKH
jgi:hypothetical protein